MKSLKKFTMLCLILGALTSNAQDYRLMPAGQKNPFDTLAVAIKLSTYRLETYQIKVYKKLIADLRLEVDSLTGQVIVKERNYTTMNRQLQVQGQNIDTLKRSVSQLSRTYDELHNLAIADPESKPIWQQNWFWAAVGAIASYFLFH